MGAAQPALPEDKRLCQAGRYSLQAAWWRSLFVTKRLATTIQDDGKGGHGNKREETESCLVLTSEVRKTQ